MAATEKQASSEKYKNLTLATLDYLIEHHTGEIVLDGIDPIRQSFELQKVQAEKYASQGKLTNLRKQFDRLIPMLQSRTDLNFTRYIKERTGYDVDIYAELREVAAGILSRGLIQNDSESQSVNILLQLLAKTNENPQQEKLFEAYRIDYVKRRSVSGKRDESRTISFAEKDGLTIETVEIIIGPKPKHYKHKMMSSPDSEKTLTIDEWSDGRQASTSVTIAFRTASAGIYQVEGIHPEIDACWQDNNTVVVKTSKEYTVQVQHRQICSFTDVVNIEYAEK